ncbi:barstar family protein [Streptomyces flaveus]|uniref:barstar family protein n=1 Tax=Streptomyces flaveus TaxID=66370 RepID=UPI0033337AE3
MTWLELTPDEPRREALSAVIHGTGCRTAADLFSEWARTLDFPPHFGRNWDAFHDCLTEKALWYVDLDGPPPTHPLTILVEDASHLLADAPDRDLAVLLQTVSDAATVARTDEDAYAHQDGYRIHLLLHDAPDRLPLLARRLEAAGFASSGTGTAKRR